MKSVIPILISSIYFLFGCSNAFCQEQIPFRQFYFNPYLFNPSYNAISGFTEIGVVYRKQWVNFNDAPTISGINFQIPTNSKVSLGFSFISQEVIALRNSTLMATFGYTIPLAEDQQIRFGLSGGLGMNNLNLKEGEYDPNDPLIINALQNNFYIDGNFGASYHIKGLSIGFALPHLFNPSFVSSNEFGVEKFSPINNQLVTANYKIKTKGIFSIEPLIIYRNSNELKFHSFDVGSILHFKDKISIGGTYGTSLGPGFFLGMDLGSFRFSYSFELPPSNTNFTNTNSHEIQLAARLGNKRVPQYIGKSKQEPVTQPMENLPKQEVREIETKEPDKQTIHQPIEPNPQIAEPVQSPNDHITQKETLPEKLTSKEDISAKEVQTQLILKDNNAPPRTFKLSNGHYVIAGVFKIMQNAIGYAQDLALKGYSEATVAVHPQNDLYYVYVFSSYDIEDTRKARNQLRLKRPLSEAWILTIEKD